MNIESNRRITITFEILYPLFSQFAPPWHVHLQLHIIRPLSPRVSISTLDAFISRLDAFISTLDAFFSTLDAFISTLDAFISALDASIFSLDAFISSLGAFMRMDPNRDRHSLSS
jgi:hypothetical protein